MPSAHAEVLSHIPLIALMRSLSVGLVLVLPVLAAAAPESVVLQYDAKSNSPVAWIGGHHCTVYNAAAPYVVVVFHGYLNNVADYYPLAWRLAENGYAAVVPMDCNGVDAIGCAAHWGKDVAAAVRDWAGTRPVGIVGHSMGGGAAMAAAKFTPGLAAYVAMHPAPIVSGAAWAKVKGPIMFTTGTYDDGTIGGRTLGATAPDRSLTAYNAADGPKALINVKGNVHESSITAKGDEWAAVNAWLACFVKRSTQNCEWVRTTMCNSANLEWCYHWGLQTAMFTMESLHI